MGGSPPKFQEGDNPAAFSSSLLFRVNDFPLFDNSLAQVAGY